MFISCERGLDLAQETHKMMLSFGAICGIKDLDYRPLVLCLCLVLLICGSLPISGPLCSGGFSGLVCGRNLWIKVISRSSTFSQGFGRSLLPLCSPECVIAADMCYHRTHAPAAAAGYGCFICLTPLFPSSVRPPLSGMVGFFGLLWRGETPFGQKL